MIDLSIVIVNHNTKRLLSELLDSLLASEKGQYQIEIIVVDNASTDGSVEIVKKRYPSVQLLVNKENRGFAVANNQGLRLAKGEYLLLLNSDTRAEKETLLTMLDFMHSHSEYQAATCRVELVDGRLDPACHRGIPTPWAAFTYFSKLEVIFPKSRIFSQYHQGWKDLQKVHDVAVISGAFLLISRRVIDKVGLLDEGYFMYGEDIDWCLRIKKAGYRIAFVPDTKITHVKGQSGRRKKSENNIMQNETNYLLNEHFWQTMKLFYKKHFSKKYPKPLMWLIFKVIDGKIARRAQR